jgi:hypothetical protein
MVTYTLVRTEINIPQVVKNEKFDAAMANAQDEIQRLADDLEALVIPYGDLLNDANFTEDGGDTYRLTYTHISYLAKGYDDDTDSDYTGLISDIDTAIQSNGKEALTDRDKLRLQDAGRDFRKAEVYLTLAYYALSGGLRPTNDGGWIYDIGLGTGRTRIMTLQELRDLKAEFRKRAYNQIYDWLRDPDANQYASGDSINYTGDPADLPDLVRYPETFHSPDFGMMAVPSKKKKSTNPRERYTG